MKSNLPNKILFRIDEVAALFDVHPRTIRRWIKGGILGFEKLAGSIRISRNTIIKFRTQTKKKLKKV